MQLPHSFLWRHRTGRSQPMLAGSFCLQRDLLRSGKRSPADAENALGKAGMTIKKILMSGAILFDDRF